MVAEVADPADLPSVGGAYALVIDLTSPAALPRTPPSLPPGRYVYAGSAFGPGGIRARVGRHLRTDKTLRWHVDHLTNEAGVSLVLALPGGNECALVAELCGRYGATAPAPGFGSSDCRTCPAHLVAVDAKLDPAAVARRLGIAGTVIWCRRNPRGAA